MIQMNRSHRARSVLLAGFLSLAAACSSAKKNETQPVVPPGAKTATATQENPSQKGAAEIVAPGHVIALSSLSDSNLNGRYRVDFEGNLKLPYNVVMKADGMAIGDLARAAQNAFAQYFKAAPNLQANIVERQVWVDVRGLVSKPAQVLVKPETSLDELISKTEGLQKSLDQTPLAQYVRIQQKKETRVIKLSDYYTGSDSLVPRWEGGDTVFFQRERGDTATTTGVDPRYIQILGEVRTPGEYLYNENVDFLYYLSKAGGPSTQADLTKIWLIRGQGKDKETIDFDLEDVDDLPALRGGDIIIVNADRASPFEVTTRVGSSIAAILGSIISIVLIIIAL